MDFLASIIGFTAVRTPLTRSLQGTGAGWSVVTPFSIFCRSSVSLIRESSVSPAPPILRR
jgi:hypothetical protein